MNEFDLQKRWCFYFRQIANIPRGSGNEKEASDYIVQFAKEHGLNYKQDSVWNVIVDKPATEGYEDAEPIILQAHLDVVCEKNQDVEHDFTKDPLDLYVEDGWLKARGTTLGADDGYGVSYMLAILEDDTLSHPALSCIFTTMEEIGLLGAMKLTKSDLHAKRMINLDGGGEVETTVSSAGGACVKAVCRFNPQENDLPAYKLSVRGLQGGHSGGSIHEERGNANRLAARILKELMNHGMDVTLSAFHGGLKYNAIPREADVVFVSGSTFENLQKQVEITEKEIQRELEFSDAGFFVKLEQADAAYKANQQASEAWINYLYLIPDGFMHRSLPLGITSASLNAGVVETKDNCFILTDMIRSALSSDTDLLIDQLKTLGRILHIEAECTDRFMGWAYKSDSSFRKILKDVCSSHGITLEEKATHGGLECGVFSGLDPDLDIITYGPVAYGCHTPEERLDLASFDRCYGILCEALAAAN